MNRKDRETYDLLVKASRYIDPVYGELVYDMWLTLNERHWDGRLHPIGIIFGLIAHGNALGIFEGARCRRITLHRSLVAPASDDPWEIGDSICEALVIDCLLHQMIHASIFDQAGASVPCVGHGSHNNVYFVEAVNRLAPQLGLPNNAEVQSQRRFGEKVRWLKLPDYAMSREHLAGWPYSVRPEGYFTRAENHLVSALHP